MGGASVVLGGSHQILDGHVFGLGMTNYTIKKSYTIRFATMNSEKTLQSKKKTIYIYIYICRFWVGRKKLSVLGTGRKKLSVLGTSGDHLGPSGDHLETIWRPSGDHHCVLSSFFASSQRPLANNPGGK